MLNAELTHTPTTHPPGYLFCYQIIVGSSHYPNSYIQNQHFGERYDDEFTTELYKSPN